MNFKEDFPKNCLGELSNSSSRMRTHDCFEESPSNSPRRVVQYILPKLGSMFSRTKTFCFENSVFLTLGLGLREGVSEESRSGKGVSHILLHIYHVDIQVGSCICLNVFDYHYMCTQVESNPCRKLSLLGIAHPVEGKLFQVQGVFGKTALIRGHF